MLEAMLCVYFIDSQLCIRDFIAKNIKPAEESIKSLFSNSSVGVSQSGCRHGADESGEWI